MRKEKNKDNIKNEIEKSKEKMAKLVETFSQVPYGGGNRPGETRKNFFFEFERERIKKEKLEEMLKENEIKIK